MSTTDTQDAIGRLRDELARARDEGVLVAMSGGVDSCTLAALAHDVLGEAMLAVTLDAESSADAEVQAARRLARSAGIPHRVVDHSELSDPDYVKNDPLRCYFCREGMVETLEAVAAQENLGRIAMGYLPDDRLDHTPGRVAARKAGAWFPYVEADVDKAMVRQVAAMLDLEMADRPSNACLSSRIAYGLEVTAEKLEQVERAEAAVRELASVEQVRVRHHGDVARIEVPPDARDALLEVSGPVTTRLEELGFTWVSMDLLGYRTGSMNEAIEGELPERPAEG